MNYSQRSVCILSETSFIFPISSTNVHEIVSSILQNLFQCVVSVELGWFQDFRYWTNPCFQGLWMHYPVTISNCSSTQCILIQISRAWFTSFECFDLHHPNTARLHNLSIRWIKYVRFTGKVLNVQPSGKVFLYFILPFGGHPHWLRLNDKLNY